MRRKRSVKTGAIFDLTEQYRYVLWREWDSTMLRVGFVMLNPSQADAIADDPTIRRCIGFARAWGYGALEVVNLFAYRTAFPKFLRQVSDPVGSDNDLHLEQFARRVDRIVLAWGNWGSLYGRDRAVLEQLMACKSLYCFGLTKNQQPRHPLYLKRNATVRAITSKTPLLVEHVGME